MLLLVVDVIVDVDDGWVCVVESRIISNSVKSQSTAVLVSMNRTIGVKVIKRES